MNKNILLAGILSILAIFGTVYVYNTFFHKEEASAAQAEPAAPVSEEEETPLPVPVEKKPLVLQPSGDDPVEKLVILENELFQLSFTTLGGRLSSAVLKNYKNRDGGRGVELVLPTIEGVLPFQLRSGGFTGEPLNDPFYYSLDPSGQEVTFYRDFLTSDNETLTCRKTFTILPGEYMVRLAVRWETASGSPLPEDGEGFLYSLEYGPHLGPQWDRLDGRYDYRYYYLCRGGEKKNMRPSAEGFLAMDDPADWLGIEGKYFVVLSVPPGGVYSLAWDARTPADDSRLSFFYNLPAQDDNRREDTFFYFLGPKDRNILARYDQAEDNGFNLQGLNLRRLIPGASVILALSDGLAFILKALHAVIPNYGVVIILFTLLIELAMFPLTRRSYNTTAKLRRIGPQIQEIKRKYAYDKEKMFSSLQELYAREEVRGRLNMYPLLVHLPVFMLLYSILSTNIGFHLEPFIPGWIPDISRPDVIWDIYPMAIPVLGWTAFRGLPLLMFVTSIMQSRLTQAPDQLGRSMIFMSFLLPILLLFVMYNMPSGVVLYWTVHNTANLAYQFYRRKKG
ncbi:MAG: membrane protein insertase YidC [Spirochaetales bacterium]|nr:membrane protein insertase YidC [Spirochaetales bacterium]